MTSISPTPEQEAVIAEFNTDEGNLIVEALAGSAKTTTIKLALQQMQPPAGKVCAVAFNKRIQKDLEKELPATVTTKTLNSIGHAAWAGAIGKKISLDTDKMFNICRAVTASEKDAWELTLATRTGAMWAKNIGYVPETARKSWPYSKSFGTWDDVAEALDEEGYESKNLKGWVDAALLENIRQAYAGMIDFSDQIYMSCCFGGRFPRFDTVVVDEAQDLSPMNHEMLRRMCARRLVAIGDSYQSIYAFRGADSNSMDKLKDMFSGKVMRLTTCFRCAEAVIKYVQRHVPSIKPWKSGGGSVEHILGEWSPRDLAPGSAVLCCRNAPLFRVAFAGIRAGVSVHILGGDIGKGVLKLAKDLSPSMDAPSAELKAAIEPWYQRKVTDKPEAAGRFRDQADVLKVVSDQGKTCGEVIEKLNLLLARTDGTLTLSSGHKSKGFEWGIVYHLEPELLEWQMSKSAGEAWTQSRNLYYVIETRAKEKLVTLRLGQMVDENGVSINKKKVEATE